MCFLLGIIVNYTQKCSYRVWFRSSMDFDHVDPQIFLLHELLGAWSALPWETMALQQKNKTLEKLFLATVVVYILVFHFVAF